MESAGGERSVAGGTKDAKTGRWLTLPAAMREKQWKKGESPNPTGFAGAYQQSVRHVRNKSSDIIDRMMELAELGNVDADGTLKPLTRRADPRVVGMSCQWLWAVAWGKGDGAHKVGSDDKPGVTIEQRRDEAMAILQAAFERVIVASKAQEEQAQVVEPAETIIEQDGSDNAAT